MTVTVEMNADEVLRNLAKFVKNLDKEIKIVNGKTARRGKSIIAKEVQKNVAVKQKDVRKHIKSMSLGKRSAAVDLENSPRLPLRDFGARQTKAGVSYKIDKSGGRKTIKGSFQGPKPGQVLAKWNGRVFVRDGKKRTPIRQLFGVSAWGVIRRRDRRKAVGIQIQAELQKQMRERLRYKKLKAEGVI